MTNCKRFWVHLVALGVPAIAVMGTGVAAGAQGPALTADAVAPKYIGYQVDPPAPPQPPPPGQAGDLAVKDDLFAGTEKFAKGASDVTEVNMDPDTLDMVKGSDAKRAHRMVLNVVRTYSYDKPGMYNVADVEEFRRKLETGDWHCSVHTRDMKTGESTDICSKRRPPDMVETAIITVAPKALTFIHTIRRSAGGGDSRLDSGLGLGLGFGGLPPAAMMAMMRPEMDAEMSVAMAELRAHSAEINNGIKMLDMPKLKSPEMQQEMKHLQDQLKEAQKAQSLQLPPEQMLQLQKQLKELQTAPQQ